MALDLIEKGDRVPGLGLVNRIAAAGGGELILTRVTSPVDVDVTLADAASKIDVDDASWTWRWLTSDFVANEFVPAGRSERVAMLRPAPAGTGDHRWDRFVEALAEHVASHADVDVPTWVPRGPVDHGAFWWPVHGDRPSTRAAAMAHSPASFARRGILVDGRELPRILP